MGSGGGKQKYGTGELGPDSADPTKKSGPRIIQAKAKAIHSDQNFDTNAWRAPKTKGGASSASSRPIRGPPPPPKGMPPIRGNIKQVDPEEVPTKWSPRKGGLSETERQAVEAHKKEKEKEKEAAKRLHVLTDERRTSAVSSPSPSPKQSNQQPVFHALSDAPGNTMLPNMVPDEVPTIPMHALADASIDKTEEPADYAVLADTADKIWKELLNRLSNSEEGVEDLFLFDEIKSAVEAAEKKIEAADRSHAKAKRAIEDRKSELQALSDQIEKVSKERVGAAYNWKRGDFAIRRKMGLCELLAVHRKHGETKVEVRIINSESFASPNVLDLVPLNLGQESNVKKKLQEIEDAKHELSQVDRESMKLQKELKIEYQKLSDRLDKELEKHDLIQSVCPEPTAPPCSLGAPGAGGLDLAWTPADRQKAANPVPVYPNMDDLFSAANNLLKTPPPGVPVPSTPIAMHSLNNTPNLTNGTDPSIPPGGITRDMLPTPMRFRIDESVDGDEDEDNLRKSPNQATQLKSPKLESTPHMEKGPEVAPEPTKPTPTKAPQEEAEEWDAYTDAEGDTYYHNPKTGATEWALPPGARVRDPSAPSANETTKDTVKGNVDVAPSEAAPESTGKKVDQVKTDTIVEDFSSQSTSLGQGSGPRNGRASDTTEGSQVASSAATHGRNDKQEEKAKRESIEWVMYHTADGAPYYHNKITGETQWDLPPGAIACSPEEDEEEENAKASAQNAEDQYKEQWAQYGQQQYAQQQQQWAEYGQQQWAQQQQQQQELWAQQQQAAAAAQQWAQQQQAQAQQQQEQWSQYYSQYWSWCQQQQEARQQQGGSREEPAPELSPPPPEASVEEQLAYAMQMIVLKELETMVNNGTSVDERKKALKNLQIKWHPDKNPEQLEVAKSIFQMLGDKKEWFLKDKDAEPDLLLSVDAVD